MKKVLLVVLTSIAATAYAGPNDCPATSVTTITPGTTVIFYRALKNNQAIYVPLMNVTQKDLTSARATQLPREVTLYDLRTNKPIQVKFRQLHDDVDYATCRSIGNTTGKINDSSPALFASQPISAEFDFTPAATLQDQFKTMIANPCQPNQKPFDKFGVTTCDADSLIAVSHFFGKTQFWRTKQYRHDIGFAVNSVDAKSTKTVEIIEDCTRCKD